MPSIGSAISEALDGGAVACTLTERNGEYAVSVVPTEGEKATYVLESGELDRHLGIFDWEVYDGHREPASSIDEVLDVADSGTVVTIRITGETPEARVKTAPNPLQEAKRLYMQDRVSIEEFEALIDDVDAEEFACGSKRHEPHTRC